MRLYPAFEFTSSFTLTFHSKYIINPLSSEITTFKEYIPFFSGLNLKFEVFVVCRSVLTNHRYDKGFPSGSDAFTEKIRLDPFFSTMFEEGSIELNIGGIFGGDILSSICVVVILLSVSFIWFFVGNYGINT